MSIKVESITEIQQKVYSALTDPTKGDFFPNNQLWLIEMPLGGMNTGGLEDVNNYIIANLSKYDFFTSNWNLSKNQLTQHLTQFTLDKQFYILARGVSVPGENLNANRDIGLSDQAGLLKGWSTTGREGLPTLSLQFIETTSSFVDFFIRPWLMLVSRKSLKVNKLKLANLKITMYLIQPTIGSSVPQDNTSLMGSNPMIIKKRKEYTFFNLFPLTVDSEEYNYTGDTVIQRQITFGYSHYKIDFETYSFPNASIPNDNNGNAKINFTTQVSVNIPGELSRNNLSTLLQ